MSVDVSSLWRASPTIRSLLRHSPDLEMARRRLFLYLLDKEETFGISPTKLHPLDLSTQKDCAQVLKNVLTRYNERRVGFSALAYLWSLARETASGDLDGLSQGFIEEFRNIFRGIEGKSKIYLEDLEPYIAEESGRAAAHRRSKYLDRMSSAFSQQINRYPSGLDPEVIEKRRANRDRILEVLRADSSRWSDWRWHLKHQIKSENGLASLIRLTESEAKGIRRAARSKIPFSVTPYYVSLMDQEPDRTHDHAVRAQVIPTPEGIAGLNHLRNEAVGSSCLDFMGESDTSPIDLVTRRYPMIAIFKPFNSCFQICQYCQRNWEVTGLGEPGATPTDDSIRQAINWFRRHKSINEILITGGDPLVLGDEKIDYLLGEFSAMAHVERIRIGTRAPVVLPQRFTPELLNILGKYHEPGRRELCLITHVEHAYEITPEMTEAVQGVRRLGITIYNQMVYTIENCRRFEAVATRRALKKIGIEPYYTFNTKGKAETQHFRVPIARLLQELKEEIRPLPGTLRLDQPVFNIPRLGKNYLQAGQHHEVIMIKPDGRRVYEFHPWEKNIKLMDMYLYEDVAIYDFLEELERRGENPKDYRTIWYYF